MPKSKEDRLAYHRDYERGRRDRLRTDPEKYRQYLDYLRNAQRKRRQRYYESPEYLEKKAAREAAATLVKPVTAYSKYGLTETDYQFLHDKQNGLCAICNKPETKINRKSRRVQRLSVDHDHADGRIRGLLCSRCNSSIGLMEDSAQLLESAVAYLKR